MILEIKKVDKCLVVLYGRLGFLVIFKKYIHQFTVI